MAMRRTWTQKHPPVTRRARAHHLGKGVGRHRRLAAELAAEVGVRVGAAHALPRDHPARVKLRVGEKVVVVLDDLAEARLEFAPATLLVRPVVDGERADRDVEAEGDYVRMHVEEIKHREPLAELLKLRRRAVVSIVGGWQEACAAGRRPTLLRKRTKVPEDSKRRVAPTVGVEVLLDQLEDRQQQLQLLAVRVGMRELPPRVPEPEERGAVITGKAAHGLVEAVWRAVRRRASALAAPLVAVAAFEHFGAHESAKTGNESSPV